MSAVGGCGGIRTYWDILAISTCEPILNSRHVAHSLVQRVTSWSVLMGWPRMSSARLAKPLTSASSNTSSVPPASFHPCMTGEISWRRLSWQYNCMFFWLIFYIFHTNEGSRGLSRTGSQLVSHCTLSDWGNYLSYFSVMFDNSYVFCVSLFAYVCVSALCLCIHACVCTRVLNMDDSPWTEEEEEPAEHPYYNNIPGKMPPPGGFIDTRLTNQMAGQDGNQVR